VKRLDRRTCNPFRHVQPHIGGLVRDKRLGKLELPKRKRSIRSGKYSVELGSHTLDTLFGV